MKIGHFNMSIKRALRPFLRPIIRWLLYFRYETHYSLGEGDLSIGRKVALGNTLFNLSSGNIKVGDYAFFGHDVSLITGVHKFNSQGYRAGLDLIKHTKSWGGGDKEVPRKGRDIEIGEGCWIASGAIILGGVSIGCHSIVAAGAVVTKSFPSHSIVAGIPAVLVGSTKKDN